MVKMKRWMHEWIDKREICMTSCDMGFELREISISTLCSWSTQEWNNVELKKLKKRQHWVCKWWIEEWHNKKKERTGYSCPWVPLLKIHLERDEKTLFKFWSLAFFLTIPSFEKKKMEKQVWRENGACSRFTFSQTRKDSFSK